MFAPKTLPPAETTTLQSCYKGNLRSFLPKRKHFTGSAVIAITFSTMPGPNRIWTRRFCWIRPLSLRCST